MAREGNERARQALEGEQSAGSHLGRVFGKRFGGDVREEEKCENGVNGENLMTV